MTSLRDMGCILIMCIFGTAFAKDTDYNIQRKVDVLENKVADITKKGSTFYAFVRNNTYVRINCCS